MNIEIASLSLITDSLQVYELEILFLLFSGNSFIYLY